MPRKKVNLQFITSDSVRRTTFKKRRRGLLKKLSELSILCDVKACAVIYEPGEPQPEIWPNEHDAKNMLQGFKSTAHMESSKKMMDQEAFLRQRVAKQYEQLRRSAKDLAELEMNSFMYQAQTGKSLHSLSAEKASALCYHTDAKTNEVIGKMKTIEEQKDVQVEAATASEEEEEEVAHLQTKCFF